jgi:acyl-coenzyme A thioesterase PaaI-like protein
MTSPQPNRLQRELARLQRLPAPLARWLRRWVIGRTIPFVGTAALEIAELSPARATLRLPDRRRVRNHVRGPHAAATALLAETASGLAFGMHLPDDKLPLLKSMSLSYLRRSVLPQEATAWLDPAQIRRLHAEERGDLAVAVRVSDGIRDSEAPVDCEMIWAWVPKRKTPEGPETATDP